MPQNLTLYKIFKMFLDHNSHIYRQAINFHKGKEFEEILKNIFDNNSIRYKYQPNGTQQFPDFLLPDYDIEINIECKTSKNGKIIWNSGFPHSNMILLYASNISQANDITFFLGEELVDETTRNDVKRWGRKKNQILKEEFSTNFNLPDWDFYLREMYNWKINNVLRHPRREQWENNVLMFLHQHAN